MNANEFSLEASERLHRIKTVSKIVRYVVLGFFVVGIGFILVGLPGSFKAPPYLPRDPIANTLVMLAFDLVLCVWYWNLAKLFQFYERGLIFSAQTTQRIKALGFLCVVGGLLKSIWHIMERLFPPPPPAPLPPGIGMKAVTGYGFDFFFFSIAGINRVVKKPCFSKTTIEIIGVFEKKVSQKSFFNTLLMSVCSWPELSSSLSLGSWTKVGKFKRNRN